MLVGLEVVKEIVETVIATGRVASPITCSTILVGPSGCGKSQSILAFKNVRGICVHPDLTSMKMGEILAADKNSEITHFVVPDLNACLSHKPAVTNLFLATLLRLQSEGEFAVGEGTRIQTVHHKPVGLITACTRDMYEQYHKKMRLLGLIRRNAPIFYTLSSNTIEVAQEQKIAGIFHGGDQVKMILPKSNPQIPRPQGEIISALSESFASNLSLGPVWASHPDGSRFCKPGKVESLLPLGPHDFLRTMAKAHALVRGKTSVDDGDVKFLKHFIRMSDYSQEQQL